MPEAPPLPASTSCQENYEHSVIVGYLWTLDDMVGYVIDQAGKVNSVQVIIMIVEGCVLCSIAVLYIWILTKQVRVR